MNELFKSTINTNQMIIVPDPESGVNEFIIDKYRMNIDKMKSISTLINALFMVLVLLDNL